MDILACYGSVRNLIDRIEMKDVPDVQAAGVDDIATRKGMDYATVVYNLEDGTMLDLLPDRDGNELRKWLVDHPKIKIVARDRAGAYAKAITEVLPMCMQVADCFHLFQNLMGYIKDIKGCSKKTNGFWPKFAPDY